RTRAQKSKSAKETGPGTLSGPRISSLRSDRSARVAVAVAREIVAARAAVATVCGIGSRACADDRACTCAERAAEERAASAAGHCADRCAGRAADQRAARSPLAGGVARRHREDEADSCSKCDDLFHCEFLFRF